MTVIQSIAVEADELRCIACGRILAKGSVWTGTLEIVCSRCKTRNYLRATSPNHEPHDGLSRPQGENYAPSYPLPQAR